MVMKSKRIILLGLIFVLVISAVTVGIFVLREEPSTLTEEQYELLERYIRPELLKQMNNARRNNVVMFLEAIREVDFRENLPIIDDLLKYEIWFLEEELGIGKIKELAIVRVYQGISDYSGSFVAELLMKMTMFTTFGIFKMGSFGK